MERLSRNLRQLLYFYANLYKEDMTALIFVEEWF